MSGSLQMIATLLLTTMLAWPLGRVMIGVYEGSPPAWLRWLRPLEHALYRLARIDPAQEMTWRQYASAFLGSSTVGILLLYAFQRCQTLLPWNPAELSAVSPWLAFNAAVSFVSNTNWQSYGGEYTMSHWVQAVGLGVQNFLSAGAGLAILVALTRGFARTRSQSIGNFWSDWTRSVIYLLLPLSLFLSVALVSQGVVQTFEARVTATMVDPAGAEGEGQILAVGPVASQVAIKQLGTNGGGYFNTNSAHPFENPTPLSNLFELISILLLPLATCFYFGQVVRDRRQGVAIAIAMFLLLLPPLWWGYQAEQAGTPGMAAAGADLSARAGSSGGNMEGKETRFGIAQSVLWSVATTAASNGSVNSMHDSYTPLGGLAPLWMMQLGEVSFGGVGSGLYGMLVFVIVTVFAAGLMVGRTPEYLGKKIDPFEMKMASIVLLIPSLAALVGTAIACANQAARASIPNPGPHGFSELLYAFTSAANNNGSAFAGLNANTDFLNGALGVCMLVGRFWVAVPILALAGALARKPVVPAGSGTLPTHVPLFVLFLCAVVVIVGALTYLPALALGPIVEHLAL
ncbi:MAG: potassium-transporting ATPase subunit KdpA [Candidatus Eisenbacteria bacterium]|nr:potassium-transporting ATPase subunit KdpA [Candidatus Eisenbacteria bacterium]